MSPSWPYHRVAVLALEGSERANETASGPLRAPIPLHAAKIFNRLFAAEPGGVTIDSMRTELVATRDQPRRVTSSWRGAHIALLASLLSVPVFLMFVIPFLGVTISELVETQMRYQVARYGGETLDMLDKSSRRELAAAASLPDSVARQAAAEQRAQDLQLEQHLQKVIDRQNQERETILRMARPLAKSWFIHSQRFVDRVQLTNTGAVAELRKSAEQIVAERLEFPEVRQGVCLVVGSVIVVFPALWIVWAFLWRGGLSLRLMGLTLLRGSGRRAWRIQCAWRTFIIWAPVAGLLLIATWLDFMPWLDGDPTGDFGWAYWLSWVCWGLALALVPIYVALALWYPERAPHDRLAGTYLVPR